MSQLSVPGEPRLYTELAEWWPLLSPPSQYGEEAAHLLSVLKTATSPPHRTLLELGSGGGSLAFHLKSHFELTLTDRSAAMLDVSRRVNPECEHIAADMRALRLDRTFDLVLIHDAIMYAADRASLAACLATAAHHCRAGGALLVAPDHMRETFEPASSTGGEDAPDGRGLRYLEWTWDPDPSDDTIETAFALLLRGADGSVRLEGDRHVEGLFARAIWLESFRDAGFSPRLLADPWERNLVIGIRLPPPADVR